MQKKSMRIAAYLLTAIMLSTGMLYLSVASDEYRDHQQEAHANTETGENEAEENEYAESSESSESAGFGDMGEVVFFSIIGTAYIPIGIWILRKKELSKKPYLIAMVGSALLIGFYVATRTINIPMIGLQDDVGVQDLTAKILQGTIVVVSGFMLFVMAKHKKTAKLA